MTDITEDKLRSIGFKMKRYQGTRQLALDLSNAVASDRQWIEVGPATESHGYLCLRRWVDQEDDQVPPDLFEVHCKDFAALVNLLKALGAELPA